MQKVANSFFNLPCAIRYRDGKTRNEVGNGDITRGQASLRQSHIFPGRIPKQIAFADVGHRTSLATELHDSIAFSRQTGPPRVRCRILFYANEVRLWLCVIIYNLGEPLASAGVTAEDRQLDLDPAAPLSRKASRGLGVRPLSRSSRASSRTRPTIPRLTALHFPTVSKGVCQKMLNGP